MVKRKTRKNRSGGTNLAYTGKPIVTQSNPFLAYTGKGGYKNINAANPAIPNTGPPFLPTGTPIWNQASPQQGGTCGVGCSINPATITIGGNRIKSLGFMVGGVRHRLGCKCSKCKKRRQKRNKSMKGGNKGIPYPDGLVGQPFSPSNINTWPGVKGVPGDNNHFAQNMYLNDPQTAMKSSSLSGGGRTRKQRGGDFSNFIGQDLINLGRQFQFGIGSAYNALAGYDRPVNPLPWKDQFPNSNMNTNRLARI